MKNKAQPEKKNIEEQKDSSGYWAQGFQDLSSTAPIPFLSCSPVPNVPYFDLSIYREHQVKLLIKARSKDMYKLLRDVHFDGNYYRIKCVNLGGWEYCWDLAVRVEFFGKMQGMAIYPKRLVSQKEKKIVYRSLILVNPYQLWDEMLVNRYWNLQERLEFLIAKILFHECIHVMISLGDNMPSGCGHNEIFFEFRKLLEVSNSEHLCSEFNNVHFRLCNLVLFGASSSESNEKLYERVKEIYEFLLNEKYSHQKTGSFFHFPFNNKKIARKYAWIAAVKAGGDTQVSKRVWQIEARRLSIALKDLYDGIDRHLRRINSNTA
ncbi:MAG: hypothetical protein ACPK85_01670 [Methanosarcina sp.]